MEKHWRAFFEFPSCNPNDDDVKNTVMLELFGYIRSISLLDSTTSKIYLDIPQPQCYQGWRNQAWEASWRVQLYCHHLRGLFRFQLHQNRQWVVQRNGLVATIYIMYSRQLPWGILISYRKWNEINFISFTVNISFLISYAISFLHSVYFIFSKIYFIHSWHVFHSPTAFVSFTCGMYLILPQHLFHL